ncbi:MAG: L-serine ammonia-lyase, iron-sulfur-dependent, subunit alpha [Lachnospiraceae bacterium]|nr:L-serine ammonia-lyase, iron-sulfur-dependent, subunit alpha [Lachnospiraceae bacterium]
MMDDRAYLGGLQDFATDDIRLFDAHELARRAGISYEFSELAADNPWPGSATFELTGADGDTAVLSAQSIGGGMVTTYSIHGFPIRWQADTWAVLVWGIEEQELHAVSNEFAYEAVAVTYAEDDKGGHAVLIEFSEEPKEALKLRLSQKNAEWRILPALLPVVTTRDRRPQLFTTVDEWRKVAKERNISFVQAAVEYEKAFSGWTDQQIWDRFETLHDIWENQIHSLEKIGYDNAKDTPNLPIYGREWDRYLKTGRVLEDPLTQHIIVHAMSTNAKLPGVKIVPGPMGTGGGYLFGAVDAVREARGFSHEKVIEGLIVAAGLGAIAFTRAKASGASGCVGESGICCAMASGAITWMAGGDGYQVENAASMALQANLGIPCDPIPGGKEFPCITRTVRASVTAPLYAGLALAGIDPLIPYHEVLFAIEQQRISSTQELLHRGINAAPCAQRCQECFQSECMADRLRYEAQ